MRGTAPGTRGRGIAGALLAATVALGACALPAAHPPGAGWAVHRIQAAAIRESSGLVRSRTHPGVFWTHNDSGDRPRIFAIGPTGEALAEFQVDGARAVDWEDVAIDDAGYLYVGDFGNNRGERRDLVVYRLREPDPARGTGRVRVDRALRFRYADQERFGEDPHDFDAESLVWLDGSLYVFTKHRSDGYTTLYRLSVVAPPGEQVLEPLAKIALGGGASRILGNASAADASPDGRRIALLTYRAIFVFERAGRHPVPSGPMTRIDLDLLRTRQVEGIAWDGDALVVANEQRQLFRIPAPR